MAGSRRTAYLKIHHPHGCPAGRRAAQLVNPVALDLPHSTLPHQCDAGQHVVMCRNTPCAAVPAHAQAADLFQYAAAARMNETGVVLSNVHHEISQDPRFTSDEDDDRLEVAMRDPTIRDAAARKFADAFRKLLPKITPGNPRNIAPPEWHHDPVYLAGVNDSLNLNRLSVSIAFGNVWSSDVWARFGAEPRLFPRPAVPHPSLAFVTAHVERVLTDPDLLLATSNMSWRPLTSDPTGPTRWSAWPALVPSLAGRRELAPGVHLLYGDDWPRTAQDWRTLLAVWWNSSPDDPLADPHTAWTAVRNAHLGAATR